MEANQLLLAALSPAQSGLRLHQLIRQQNPIGERQFEIEFLGSGVEAFAFTFG